MRNKFSFKEIHRAALANPLLYYSLAPGTQKFIIFLFSIGLYFTQGEISAENHNPEHLGALINERVQQVKTKGGK